MPEIDFQALRNGQRRALAKAITLIESSHPSHRKQAAALLERCLPHSGQSLRIGISGVPGVGKSTFIEAFGLFLIGLGKRVGVLAVDPSSPLHGGSILGDKTRMVAYCEAGSEAIPARRAAQASQWFERLLNDGVTELLKANAAWAELYQAQKQRVASGEITPTQGVLVCLESVTKKLN